MRHTKFIAPQFELLTMETAFNLAGQVQRAPEQAAPKREDNTREMFSDPESGLRALWTRQGVPQSKQNEMLADVSAKATPEYMAQFFPPACDCFTPIRRFDGSYTEHCSKCGIIGSAHKF